MLYQVKGGSSIETKDIIKVSEIQPRDYGIFRKRMKYWFYTSHSNRASATFINEEVAYNYFYFETESEAKNEREKLMTYLNGNR